MSSFNDKFRKMRLDQSPYLFHFIKGDDTNPCATLEKILQEHTLRSSNGYICFSASPITAIRKFFEVKVNKTGRPLYHPWGIAFSRDKLVRDFGARNVIYTDGSESIPPELNWRTMLLDIDHYDFEYLREWRINSGEFNFERFPKEDILVIAPNNDNLNILVTGFDMEFTPCVDYINGTIEEDWSEIYPRDWKGIAVDSIGIYTDDFAISGSTQSQSIGEDMLSKIFSSALSIGTKKKVGTN